MQLLLSEMGASVAFGTTITQLLELATAELGTGLVVTHFLWELIPTWNVSVYENSVSVSLLCLSLVKCAGILPSEFSRAALCRTGRLLFDSLFAEVAYREEKLCGDNSGCLPFSKAEHSTAAFLFCLRITKQIQLICPNFPERQAFNLDLLCEKSKCGSGFHF